MTMFPLMIIVQLFPMNDHLWFPKVGLPPKAIKSWMIMETPPKSRMIWADLKASPIYGTL